MKPIWFTEYGFPSVDKASNKPNVFFDITSKESFFPTHSNGKIDYAIQKLAILSTLDFCKDTKFIEQSFYWCWNARGINWPNEEYTDKVNWPTGHWLDGKFNNNNPLYIYPTCQSNMSVKCYEDIDIIPSLRITSFLKLDSSKSIKIRDDMVMPNHNYFSYNEPCKELEINKIILANLKLTKKSKIEAERCQIIFNKKYIVVTSRKVNNGSTEDIDNQYYPQSDKYQYGLYIEEETNKVTGEHYVVD